MNDQNKYSRKDRKIFSNYKKNAIRAAKELLYGESVVKQLKIATTEAEVVRIMHSARNSK